MFASVYVLTFLFRGAGVVAPEASALAVAACASRTLFAAARALARLGCKNPYARTWMVMLP